MEVLIGLLQNYHCISKILKKSVQSDIFARFLPLLNSHSIGELDAGTLRALIAGKYSVYLMFGDVKQCSMATG